MNRQDRLRYFAATIKQAVSPEQALRLYVPGFTVNAKKFAACAFHAEKTPSMKIFPDHVYCWGCHYSGDVIKIVETLFGLDPTDAMRKLNDNFAVGLPIDRALTLAESMDVSKKSAEIAAKRRQIEQDVSAKKARFYATLDAEDRLFRLEDALKDTPPPDDPEAPFPVMYCRMLAAIPILKYRLRYEG